VLFLLNGKKRERRRLISGKKKKKGDRLKRGSGIGFFEGGKILFQPEREKGAASSSNSLVGREGRGNGGGWPFREIEQNGL